MEDCDTTAVPGFSEQSIGRAVWERVADACAFSIRDTANPVLFRGAMRLSNGPGGGLKRLTSLLLGANYL